MANEIYNTTWWGDALYTARSLEDSYEDAVILGGHLQMQDRVEQEGGVIENSYCTSLKLHKIANS